MEGILLQAFIFIVDVQTIHLSRVTQLIDFKLELSLHDSKIIT